MGDNPDRAHLEALAIDNPWTSSYEGLDDECIFCESWNYYFKEGGTTRLHRPTCVWIAAMDYLDRPHPNHEVEDG